MTTRANTTVEETPGPTIQRDKTMGFSLHGHVALVTGGGSGIGRAISELFAAHGACVALTYLTSDDGAQDTVAGIEAQGGQALALHSDLMQHGEPHRVVDATIERFGRLDILVANAGGLLQRSRIIECTDELWEASLAVNLTSVFRCCRATLPHMERAGTGSIIVLGSLAAHDGGGPGAAHYATAKAGVMTFARALAKEAGPLGIRVNGLAPGLIGTRFHDDFSTQEARQALVSRTPLQREGKPLDVAGAALFLASSYAGFITGETIEVNGGLGMY